MPEVKRTGIFYLSRLRGKVEGEGGRVEIEGVSKGEVRRGSKWTVETGSVFTNLDDVFKNSK